MTYYIGILSGTSMDAVDAAIIDFSSDNNQEAHSNPIIIAQHSRSYSPQLIIRLKNLIYGCENELALAAQIDREIGYEFAATINELIAKSGISRDEIHAIGSHGQTIRHVPEPQPGYTIQLGDPNTIAHETGIITVADFRRRDIASGGHGAPFAPLIHRYLFESERSRLIVNIGGIANVTYLPGRTSKESILGYDTGPGNCLMDAHVLRHLGEPFDNDGKLAASADVNEDVLSILLSDSYFTLPYPKSTGVDYFNFDWLNRRLSQTYHCESGLSPIISSSPASPALFPSPAELQATLCALTAQSLSTELLALSECDHSIEEVIICGGGARNLHLMKCLQEHCSPLRVKSSHAYGVDPQWVEAILFAYLAKMRLAHEPVQLSTITGGASGILLGGIYQ